MQSDNKPRENRIKLVEDNRDFIYSIASYFCNRQLQWGVDEELNIALTTFNQASEAIKDIKGNFISYSSALIKSALLEYTLKLPTLPKLVFADQNKSDKDHLESLSDFEIFFDNKERANEIALLSQELKAYSINFSDLAKNKISSEDSVILLNLAIQLYRADAFRINFMNGKKLKYSDVSEVIEINRKTFRKIKVPMVSLLILFTQPEMFYLKSYLNIVVGDANA